MNNATRVPSNREVFNLPSLVAGLLVAGYVAAALRGGPLSFGDLKYAAPAGIEAPALLSAVIRGLSTGALETDADGRIELAAAPPAATWSSSPPPPAVRFGRKGSV